MNQKKNLNKLYKYLEIIRSYEDELKSLSDEELQAKTAYFKERLKNGETTVDIMPEAYAVICEADRRVLGMFPYDEQVLGGIALALGYFAEMNTGEGKTLTATLPMYLNGLTGKSAILVTTNDYLAARDAEEMGEVYEFMGLTIGCSASMDADKQLTNDDKREIYSKDIVYTTNSILGFDYLFNNLVKSKSERFLREFCYAIVDEADEVLLDSCQMPLVISGAPRVQSNLYAMADFFVTTLKEDVDYEVEDKTTWLTEAGVAYAEKYFGIDNFYDRKNYELYRHVILALRAHKTFVYEEDYVVSEDDEVTLLDKSTGRKMKGVKLNGGQHQALEEREKVKVSQETRSIASITYQNLFRMFPELAGMSGTISNSADEIMDIYEAEVVKIPTHKEMERIDRPDRFFPDSEKQFRAAIDLALETHAKGQPVLIVCTTIGDTEIISQLLIQEGIAHSVLNANNAYWEAQMVKEAGQMGTVTVATSMAGRGTDIKLGPGVKELGGLAVIGIGRMENIRAERQARGRSGRQGDPGFSQFFVSLEDDIVDAAGSKRLESYIEGRRRISERKLKKIINKSQKIGEENAVSARKRAFEFDIVMQLQRKLMYETRNNLLDGGTVERERILEVARENASIYLDSLEEIAFSDISRYILDNISYTLDIGLHELDLSDKEAILAYLVRCVEKAIDEQRGHLDKDIQMNDFIRVATLSAIDDAWVEEVDYLQQLKGAVSGRASAQRNIAFEYQAEALESFYKMETLIKRNMIRNIMLSEVYVDEEDKLHILLP